MGLSPVWPGPEKQMLGCSLSCRARVWARPTQPSEDRRREHSWGSRSPHRVAPCPSTLSPALEHSNFLRVYSGKNWFKSGSVSSSRWKGAPRSCTKRRSFIGAGTRDKEVIRGRRWAGFTRSLPFREWLPSICKGPDSCPLGDPNGLVNGSISGRASL